MIYLFHGTDTQKTRAKAKALINALLAKKPDASYFKHTVETLNEGALDELIQGQGLFERKFIIYMDSVLEDSEKKELVLSKIEPIKESENIFIILEKNLDAKSKKIFEKFSEKIQVFDEKENKEKIDFNIFGITYALGRGDIKKAWSLFDEARRKEFKGEEIHGVLWWQIKKMYSQNPADQKIKRNLFEMMSIYHEAHRGQIDLMRGLERWVLEFGK